MLPLCLAGALVPAALVFRKRGAGRRRAEAAQLSRGQRIALCAQDVAPRVFAEPSKADLKKAFAQAAGGTGQVTFKQATRLEGADGVLEEGAATERELENLWGDLSQPKSFDDFKQWYVEVLRLYDEFLWKGAVAPPVEAFEGDYDDEEEDQQEYTDEELLEDATARMEVFQIPTPEEEGLVTVSPIGKAEASKQSLQITRLFREGCDEDNLMSFEGLQEIPDVEELLESGELSVKELKELWAPLPKKDGRIDVLAFRDFMKKVDELFEYVDENEEPETKGKAVAKQEDENRELKIGRRTVEKAKKDLMVVLDELTQAEKRKCGLDGREETDPPIVKFTEELENLWRQDVVGEDFENFDVNQLIGDWEMIYSTSPKFRRWGTVLNAGREVKEGEYDLLVQSFAASADDEFETAEYDVEEVLVEKDGKERSFRGVGTWRVSTQANVVTGGDDLVLKVDLQSVEYDEADGTTGTAPQKIIQSQMCRVFHYCFISYMDDELRVMRSGLTHATAFIFKKLPDEEEEEEPSY